MSNAPFTGRANLFARSAGRAGRSTTTRSTASTRSTRRSRVATLPALRAGRRRRDDRDGEDHSVRGRAPRRSRPRRLPAADGAVARRALSRPLKVGVVSTLLPGLKPRVIEKTLQDHRRAAGAAPAPRSSPNGACRTRRARWRARSARCSSRRRARHRVRRFGDRRPARRDPGGARGDRRPHRAFRHAGRSRQSAADRPSAGQAGARRAGLRAQPEGERLRLGAACAFSPALPVARADITGMGVGGLLMEIVTRPQPRDEPMNAAGRDRARRRRVAAAVRADGRSPTS